MYFIVELTINTKPGRGPDVFHKKAFTPARMGNNGIGFKTLGFKLYKPSVQGVCTDDFGFKVSNPRMNARGCPLNGHVGVKLNTIPIFRRFALHHEGMNFMATLGKCRSKVDELTWKVLMNKKKLHCWILQANRQIGR